MVLGDAVSKLKTFVTGGLSQGPNWHSFVYLLWTFYVPHICTLILYFSMWNPFAFTYLQPQRRDFFCVELVAYVPAIIYTLHDLT